MVKADACPRQSFLSRMEPSNKPYSLSLTLSPAAREFNCHHDLETPLLLHSGSLPRFVKVASIHSRAVARRICPARLTTLDFTLDLHQFL